MYTYNVEVKYLDGTNLQTSFGMRWEAIRYFEVVIKRASDKLASIKIVDPYGTTEESWENKKMNSWIHNIWPF
jgi:hypothetical protein